MERKGQVGEGLPVAGSRGEAVQGQYRRAAQDTADTRDAQGLLETREIRAPWPLRYPCFRHLPFHRSDSE
jgi:hypothetical protein